MKATVEVQHRWSKVIASAWVGTLLLITLLTSHAAATEKTLTFSYESPLIMQQGNVRITLADFVAYLNERVPEADQQALLLDPSRIAQLLNNMVLADAFWYAAGDIGLLDEPETQAAAYRAAMVAIRASYRQHFRDRTALESYEARARELYLSEPNLFMLPATYDFTHILIAVNPARTEVEAMQRVVQAVSRIEAGEDVSEVASEFNEDEHSRDRGHRYTGVSTDQLVSQMAAAVSTLSVGEWADPVRSRFGWHLIRLEAVSEPEQMDWATAQPLAEERARSRHLNASWDRRLRELQEAPVVFPPDAIQTLLQHYEISGLDVFSEARLLRAMEQESNDTQQ